MAHWWIFLLLWWCGLIGASIVFRDHQEMLLFLLPVVGLLPLLVLVLRVLFLKLSVRYRLTTHRLFKEVGIFRRTHSELELMRVDDLTLRQNLVQRLLHVGTVTLTTSDASDPRLDLEGIADPERIKEMIREHVLQRRSRTLHMESL